MAQWLQWLQWYNDKIIQWYNNIWLNDTMITMIQWYNGTWLNDYIFTTFSSNLKHFWLLLGKVAKNLSFVVKTIQRLLQPSFYKGGSEVPSSEGVLFWFFSIQLSKKHTLNPEIALLYQFHDQKALFKVPKICNISFWIENDPPPGTFSKIHPI